MLDGDIPRNGHRERVVGERVVAAAAEARLRALAEPDRVPVLQRFFQTGPGGYGEGDLFLGVRVPAVRRLARELRLTPLAELLELLQSPYHEARLLALLGMVEQFRRGDEQAQVEIYRGYLSHTRWINNWDLVDASAEHIVGGYLWGRSRRPLRKLAASSSLWERRIAVLATFHFIRRDDFDDTIDLAERLLHDEHDLMHKAVGWMLREVGSRDRGRLDVFLERHASDMPRTMLRYAIEKHDSVARQRYLRMPRRTARGD